MKDHLEDFIKKNRQEMDASDPGEELWLRLEQKLNEAQPAKRTKVVPLVRVWQMAACFALILGAMGIFQWQYNRQNHNQTLAQVAPKESFAPEVIEAEQFYIAQIKQKQTQLNNYDLKAMGLEGDFKQDITALDKMYDELKKELQITGNQEAVISAMVQNMQMRIEILNQQLELLEKIKDIKKTKKNNKKGQSVLG